MEDTISRNEQWLLDVIKWDAENLTKKLNFFEDAETAPDLINYLIDNGYKAKIISLHFGGMGVMIQVEK